MTPDELIGRVAVLHLKKQLTSEPDGNVRFCIVGFGAPLTTKIAHSVTEDSDLMSELDVRIHRSLVDGQLPKGVITEETAAHWRNKPIISGKRGILFAISNNELQRVGKTVETLSRIETDRLLELHDDWISAAGLGGRKLQDREFGRLRAALGAVNRTHVARTIEVFADYVLRASEFIKQGGRVEHALDRALPALNFPCWSGDFESIPTVNMDKTVEWSKRFYYLWNRIRPLTVLENNEGEFIRDQTQKNFNEIRNDLDSKEISVIESFLGVLNLSYDRWCKEQTALVNLDWRRISAIFEGTGGSGRASLGQRTLEFFEENFPEDIDYNECDFLRRSLDPPPREPQKEAKEFFDSHSECLARDKKLYSHWERYIYRPEEYEDFIEGLVVTLQRLQNSSYNLPQSVRLKISISGETDKKLFWQEKNSDVMRYFAYQYHGINNFFDDEYVTFDFGKLNNYYLPDPPLLREKPTRKDARSLKFRMFFESGGKRVGEEAVFSWSMQTHSIQAALPQDLRRLENDTQDRVFLCTADVKRQIVSSKGQIQRVELHNVNTLHDVNNGNQGALVDPNQPDFDIYELFQKELEELKSKEVISDSSKKKLLNTMDKFAENYTKAIRDWVNTTGKGIASSYFLEQANAYGELLNSLNENANYESCHVRLWKYVLRIGIANIGNDEQAAIITPWQPLRMAELHVKLQQVAKLVTDVVKSDPEDVYRVDLFYAQRRQEVKSVYYPEVCLGIDDQSKLLVSTSVLGGYSLAELPNHDNKYLNGSTWEALDADPNIAARCFTDISERYLDLLPHEKANFSVVLFDAESKALPKALADELSGKVEQENDLRCDLLLTHTNQGRMRQIYEQQNVATASTSGSLLSSETALNFLSRLRVGFIDPDQYVKDIPNSRAVDIVFLQDVVSRKAELMWLPAPGSVNPSFLEHVPSRWSRKRPVSRGNTSSAIYLTAPAQPGPCQMYLNTLYKVLHGSESKSEDVIPALKTDFQNSSIEDLLKKTHKIGEWVVNFDGLVDRRLLKNRGIKVIRHINDRFIDRNIVVSTTSNPELLHALLRKRLGVLNLSFSQKDLSAIADKFIDRATTLSGQVVMRAARRGHYANELLGVVLSMERLRRSLKVEDKYIGWYFLDDFATWFGQKEQQIADIMAIAPYFENGEHSLRLVISEAKYVGSRGYQTHRKKSAQQLRETVERISNALDPRKNRIDKDIWLHRIGDLMLENIELFDNAPVGSWGLHKWSEGVRSGSVPIFVTGFSHVFVHDEKASVDAGIMPVAGLNHCKQIVLNCQDVRNEVYAFAGNKQGCDIPEEESDAWEKALVSKNREEQSQSKINERVYGNQQPDQGESKNQTGGGSDENEKKPDFDIGNALSSNWPLSVLKWLEDNIRDDDRTDDDHEWLGETEKKLQRALRSYNMTAEIRDSRLTPNAALVRFRGTDDLTVQKVEKRKQELLTSHGIEVINVLPAPNEIIVMVKRLNRMVLRLPDLWSKRELQEITPESNTSFLLGMCEENGKLLYLNFDGSFAGYEEHGPHVLIAGETGSGKGVLIQNLLLDICATNSPRNARIRMIDPKSGVDFPWLSRMPHLDGGLITNQEDAIKSLEELVGEMERRYRIFATAKVQKLGKYNMQVNEEKKLPRIWLFHDEIADWMLDDDYRGAVAANANRLGMKARAAGIHLVLITQRPDKEAMPVQLRANLPNRLVLKVADQRNSELVLGDSGAEKLLGRGHLAAKLSGQGKVILAQVPFADNDEVNELANLIVNSWSQ